MKKNLYNLDEYLDKIKTIREIILTNIVLLGQTPCVEKTGYHIKNHRRVEVFLERLAEAQADECTTDTYGNPYAIIKGTSTTHPSIMLVAHLDTILGNETESIYSLSDNMITGPGLTDNSLGVGVLMSMPHILTTLGIELQSDLVIVGLIESLRESNLKSIRHVLSSWEYPIQAAVCVEGGEIGRLNYFSNSMIRADIKCNIPREISWNNKQRVNAIIIINEVINNILEIRLPQRPKTEIILGELKSGVKHGEAPLSAALGFEIHSDTDEMVKEVFEKIENICGDVSHRNSARVEVRKISNIKASTLSFHHPLVKASIEVMEKLNIKPTFESSESELSVFLYHNIPAVTLGIAVGENYHEENEKVNIESIYKGITQLIGVISAIDEGVCNE